MPGPLDLSSSASFNDLPEDSLSQANFLDEIDPDLNLLSDVYGSSSYYLTTDFNQIISRSPAVANGLSVLHLNIRSVPANLTALVSFLSTLNHNFTIIGLTETWLNDLSASRYSLLGYASVEIHRTHMRGGGTMLLIRETINYIRRVDLDMMADHCECVFAELLDVEPSLQHSHTSKIIVGCLYRPPNADFDQFMSSLESILSIIKRERKTCYLMGDVNIHMNDLGNNPQTQVFMDLLYGHLFLPLIDRPTRITPSSSSLIDNIFSNSLCSNRINGLLYTDISDHLPIFSLTTAESSREDKLITFRNYSDHNKQIFSDLLQRETWVDIQECTTVDACIEAFYAKLNLFLDEAFPLLERRQRQKCISKPWITTDLKNLIRRKNKLYVIFNKRPTLLNEIRYKSLKRTVRKVLRQSQRDYYHRQIEENSNNIKKTWEILNSLLGRTTRKGQVTELKIDNRTITNPQEIVNNLNNHFSNIGNKIIQAIPPSPLDSHSFLRGSYQQSIFFNPVTEAEVLICISDLKNCSPGCDGLRPQLVKENVFSLIKPLVHIFNLSLTQGTVPRLLKRAYITPVHKAGDTDRLNNYRPISVLNVMSKLLERLVYNRLLSFINHHSILSNSQFGFRKKHSCDLALISSSEFIRKSLDEGSHVAAVYLDLQKAFDVVSHPILLLKLEHYGIRGTPLNWFQSYLSDRVQSVKLGDMVSNSRTVTHGVPQGSVLGPLLFLLYVNDLTLSCDNEMGRLIPFADDTTLLISNPDPITLIQTVNSELEALSKWFKTNKLSVNLTKTHHMIFTLNRHLPPFRPIVMEGVEIEEVTSTKFLGVIIDNRLTWNAHIAYISSKISKIIGIIRKAGPLLPLAARIQLYKSLILPYFTYSILVWGNASRTVLERPIRLQKRAIRVVNLAPFRAHSDPLLLDCKILPFSSLYQYYCAIFVFKYFQHLLPDTFYSYFHLLRLPRDIRTRNHSISMLQTPFFRTSFGQKSLIYYCTKLYNEFIFPLGLHDTTLASLKRALQHLLS